MIVLADLIIFALSFTSIPTWWLLILMPAPTAAVSLMTHDPSAIKAGVIALLAALALYAPLVLAVAKLAKTPYAAAFRRFRPLLFFTALVLFVVVMFSLVQLVLG